MEENNNFSIWQQQCLATKLLNFHVKTEFPQHHSKCILDSPESPDSLRFSPLHRNATNRTAQSNGSQDLEGEHQPCI